MFPSYMGSLSTESPLKHKARKVFQLIDTKIWSQSGLNCNPYPKVTKAAYACLKCSQSEHESIGSILDTRIMNTLKIHSLQWNVLSMANKDALKK